MVPVHGRPFLDYVLGALADAGIADVALVVAPDHDAIRAHYAAHPPARVSLGFVVQPEALGTANAVLAAEAWTARGPFLAMNADNLYPAAALRDLASLAEPGLTAFERDDLVRTSNIPEERVLAFALVEWTTRISDRDCREAGQSAAAEDQVERKKHLRQHELLAVRRADLRRVPRCAAVGARGVRAPGGGGARGRAAACGSKQCRRAGRCSISRGAPTPPTSNGGWRGRSRGHDGAATRGVALERGLDPGRAPRRLALRSVSSAPCAMSPGARPARLVGPGTARSLRQAHRLRGGTHASLCHPPRTRGRRGPAGRRDHPRHRRDAGRRMSAAAARWRDVHRLAALRRSRRAAARTNFPGASLGADIVFAAICRAHRG